MKLSFVRKSVVFIASVQLLLFTTGGVARAQRPLPNPVPMFTGQQVFVAGGKQMIRYRYTVINADTYPSELFAAAPELPPCGTNTKASRTWVDIFDQSGKRLNGFCAFEKPGDLNKLWFALESGVIPPSWVYIEMTDRKTGTKYKSELSETTQ